MKRGIYNLLNAFIIIISVVILVSSIIYLTPVDPARLTFGQRTDIQSVQAKQVELHLDKPLWQQMVYYLNDISFLSVGSPASYADRGVKSLTLLELKDEQKLLLKTPYLRTSFQTGRPVAEMLAEAIPRTLILALVAMTIAIFIGILLGIIAAVFKDSWIDQTIIGVSTLGISVPSYVSAIIFALIFGFYLGDFTGLNIQGSIVDLNDMGDEIIVLKNLILPAIALGIRPLSIITQLLRASLLDVMSMDYIRTARAKGVAFYNIIKDHALRNAMNPVITAITGWFASLLTGTFFVENVFNFKGVGEMTVNALINYDIPVILASVIFICIVFIITNILVDYIYRFLDPKVK